MFASGGFCRGGESKSHILSKRLLSADAVASAAGVPVAGGFGAAVLLLVAEPGSPVLPGRRHRRALHQRAGQPAAAHLRGARQEPHRDGAQAGVHRRHALPPPHLRRPPRQGALSFRSSSFHFGLSPLDAFSWFLRTSFCPSSSFAHFLRSYSCLPDLLYSPPPFVPSFMHSSFFPSILLRFSFASSCPFSLSSTLPSKHLPSFLPPINFPHVQELFSDGGLLLSLPRSQPPAVAFARP